MAKRRASKKSSALEKRRKAEATVAGAHDRNKQILAKIRPVLPPDLVPIYVDNLNVTHTENEFILSFLQLQHPLLDESAPPIETVDAKCVARIIVAPPRMLLFIRALQENFQRYVADAESRAGSVEKK